MASITPLRLPLYAQFAALFRDFVAQLSHFRSSTRLTCQRGAEIMMEIVSNLELSWKRGDSGRRIPQHPAAAAPKVNVKRRQQEEGAKC